MPERKNIVGIVHTSENKIVSQRKENILWAIRQGQVGYNEYLRLTVHQGFHFELEELLSASQGRFAREMQEFKKKAGFIAVGELGDSGEDDTVGSDEEYYSAFPEFLAIEDSPKQTNKWTAWRIITERKNVPAIKQLAQQFFEGLTIFNATGQWKGQEEKSVVIEILAPSDQDNLFQPKVKDFAQRIAQHNNQQAVLIERRTCEVDFIRR